MSTPRQMPGKTGIQSTRLSDYVIPRPDRNRDEDSGEGQRLETPPQIATALLRRASQ